MSAVAGPVELLAVGMTTPVGLDAPSTAAAVRGGLTRIEESDLDDKAGAPQRLSLVPDALLPPLTRPPRDAAGASAVHSRLLRLAAPALAQVLEAAPPAALPLLVAAPEARDGVPDAVGPEFVARLAHAAGAAIDPAASALHREGGAGGLFALHDALRLVAAHAAELVCVGGVDTFLDPRRLAALDAEDRLLGGAAADGFIPGEAAAFLLLGAPGAAHRLGARPLARIAAAATGAEPGHRYSPAPYLGEGLARTLAELFAAAPTLPPVRCVYAGFNGESLPAKEWGVATLRSAERFAGEVELEHPADCTGDVGAATGPLLAGLAALGMARGYRSAPCLVWCTSDREARAAALLEAAR